MVGYSCHNFMVLCIYTLDTKSPSVVLWILWTKYTLYVYVCRHLVFQIVISVHSSCAKMGFMKTVLLVSRQICSSFKCWPSIDEIHSHDLNTVRFYQASSSTELFRLRLNYLRLIFCVYMVSIRFFISEKTVNSKKKFLVTFYIIVCFNICC